MRRQLSWLTLGALLLTLLAAGCGPLPTPTRTAELAFKGIELYSWANDAGEWQFALLPGTNRNKNMAEVQAEPVDLATVKEQLCELAPTEQVFWLAGAYDEASGTWAQFLLPPDSLVQELEKHTRGCQVNLVVLLTER